MRVLVLHNAYRLRGGEDAVVEAEIDLLRGRGHEVELLLRHNDEVDERDRLALAAGTLWSRASAHEVGARIARFAPDIVHVHNTLPLLSPSVLHAAAGAGRPVVQTLHNFRLLCPQGMLLREGRVCEDCLGRLPLPAVRHACYRDSRAQTAVVAAMLVLHRGLGTWQRRVARFIALSEYSRSKFIQGGLPGERIAVKPNFVDVPDEPPAAPRRGLLYVGRLSAEKGIRTLAEAAALAPDVGLEVAGDGPEAGALDALPGVRRLGVLAPDQVLARMRSASALVLPSICYENFPRTLAEAMACGLPVIASRLGAMQEIVRHGETGLLIAPGEPAAWAEALRWAAAHPQELAEMGRAARRVYEQRFTADENYRQLMQIYEDARAARLA